MSKSAGLPSEIMARIQALSKAVIKLYPKINIIKDSPALPWLSVREGVKRPTH